MTFSRSNTTPVRYAALLPNVVLVALEHGEGHFVYLNSCTSDLSANGVPLCVDR